MYNCWSGICSCTTSLSSQHKEMKSLLGDSPGQLHQALALLSPLGKPSSFLPLTVQSQEK